ncbi:MAG: YciI family protein [Burkholderiales bacterium]|nr:YciI family protein [Burkholderiales bacterium]
MLWSISCIDTPNTAAKRAELLASHREYLNRWDPVIFFSGPQQTDDGSQAVGSLFILNVPSRARAQEFIDGETFYRAGVFETVTIRRLRKGHFHPELADAP